jgi:hypothetical protein
MLREIAWLIMRKNFPTRAEIANPDVIFPGQKYILRIFI